MFKKADYIYALYTEGSFTKAAQKLFISQPCLSAAVKQLEEKIGAPLFERSGGKVRPTELGLAYIQTAGQILSLEETFRNHLNDIQTLATGNVRVGGSNYVASHILPRIIDEFSRQHPNVVVSLTEASSAVLNRQLNDGEVDLIVDSFDTVEPSRVHFPMVKEQILLASPTALADGMQEKCILPSELYDARRSPDTLPEVSLESFLSQPFILLKSGNSMYDHAMDIFRANNATPQVRMFLDQLATSFFLATEGNCCCFVTDTLFRYHKFDDRVALYKIKGSGSRSLDIACKKGRLLTPAEQKFIEISQQLLQQK